MNHYPSIAYICLEFGLEDTIKTYAGGLGILAGDTIKTAADLHLPFIGISLLYKNGYFKQSVDEQGNQSAENDVWDWSKILHKEIDSLKIVIGQQILYVHVWSYQIKGQQGSVPLYFIDTDHPDNPEEFRKVSDRLYAPDHHIRLLQQLVIGYGAIQVYERLTKTLPEIIHINESHAAYSIVYLLKKLNEEDVKNRFVFTTHTPVTAGHSKHNVEELTGLLGTDLTYIDTTLTKDGVLNLSELAIFYSKYTNAVSYMHREVTKHMFPESHVEAITNGVHPQTWVSHAMQKVFDQHIPEWRIDTDHLRKSLIIPDEEIDKAHKISKNELCYYIDTYRHKKLDPTIFTIGFARRFAEYKRNDLIFTDYNRLNEIGKKYGSLQLVFSGKAHPNDTKGQEYIRNIVNIAHEKFDYLNVVYIPNYGIEISKLLVSGVDLWLNNPVVPMEASGTSGMKASMNGIPNLSTIDGWWKEGSFEGLTGWNIGGSCEGEDCSKEEIEQMYDKLENHILPIYYEDKQHWINIQKHCIAMNGSYFHTKRMMEEYLLKGYLQG
jgi:starch phosphorylase